ncbi:MAG: VWA domain-containing protein [Pyrinomonadaceae bacterium]
MPAEKRNKSLPSLSVVCSLAPGRYSVVLILFFLAITLCQPASSLAQDPDEEVIRVSTDLLLFPVRIRDKRGNNVEGLTESDLSLRDNDHAVTGLYFSPGADRVVLIFALDQSGSLREIISQQRDAALGLFSRFGDKSSVAVLRFAEAASLVVPFGRDPDAARAAFSFAAGANQHTAIFDAAAKAVTMFDQMESDRVRVRSERRIVILISDGLDNASRSKVSVVIESALERRVSFYVIHLPLFEPLDGRLAVRVPAKGFRDLAEKTGGRYFLAGDSKSALQPNRSVDLTPVFQAIEADLKSQYLLGFYISASAHDGRKHRFSLSLVPPNIEYSVGRLGYSRTHEFYVNLPAGATKVQN